MHCRKWSNKLDHAQGADLEIKIKEKLPVSVTTAKSMDILQMIAKSPAVLGDVVDPPPVTAVIQEIMT
jgi:hypothetical protein